MRVLLKANVKKLSAYVPVLGDTEDTRKWGRPSDEAEAERAEERWMNGGGKREGWNETGNESLSPVSLPVTSSVWSWVLWAFPLDAHTPPHTCQDTHTHTHTDSVQPVYFIHWLRDKHSYMCFCLLVLFSHSLRQPSTCCISHATLIEADALCTDALCYHTKTFLTKQK